MKSGKLVVRHHTGWRHRTIQILLAIWIVVGAWAAYYFGQHNAGFNQLAANDTQTRLEQEISNLEQDKVSLKDQLTLAQRSNQVDGQAYQQVKNDLKLLQQEILELREEVSFYRGIVAPRESSAGIRIERLDLEKDSEGGLFRYNLVLTQVLKNDRTVRGVAKATLKGVKDGRPKSYNLIKLADKKKKSLEFKFKYFQKFNGSIVLPKGFSAREVLVEVDPHRRKKIQQTFQWPGTEEKSKVKPDKVDT